MRACTRSACGQLCCGATNEFASLTARSIGRGAVAPSQTLPGDPPSPATTGTAGDTIAETPKTVSRKEPGRSATTGAGGDNRPKRSRRGKGGRRSRSILRSKSLGGDFGTAGKRGKIDSTRPSLEQGLSGPIKRVGGTGSTPSSRPRTELVSDPARRYP